MLKFTSADSGSEESLITSPTMYFLIPTAEKIYMIYIYIYTHASGVATQHIYMLWHACTQCVLATHEHTLSHNVNDA